MVRAQVAARKRCYNHPHRETEVACTRCRISYCQECIGEPDADGTLLCVNCRREVEAAIAARLTLGQRAVLQAKSFGRGLIVAGVLAAVLVIFFLLFKDSINREITPEEMARFRYAMTGGFSTPEGINLNSTVVGGQVVAVSSEAPGHPVKQIINEYTGENIPAWRSADATFPQEITIEFGQRGAPQKAILQNNPGENPDTWPRQFEVLISVESSASGFVPIGVFTAEQTSELQRFEFPRTVANWVKVRILSNYGSTEYTSLDEFGAYNVPDSPMGPAGPTPKAAP